MTQHEESASDAASASHLAPAAGVAGSSELSGAILGERYHLQRFLSQGATARVYLARDLETEGTVAIKVLSPEAADKPGLRACVEREGKVAARVKHPNVVSVLGEGVTASGLPYLVMEALEGESLDAVLRRRGAFPLPFALEIVKQAAQALCAAHEAGVIHRDVKPGNLLVLRHHDRPFVKLLDFGMAKLSHDPIPADEPPTVLGTIEYMAPEQIVVESVDARADIYSLGVVLFRLVTGHLPFEAEAGPMVLRHQLFSPVPPPSWLAEQIDPQIEALVLNATRKHPDNRYPTMQAFLADLEAVLEPSDRMVEARPLSQRPDAYVPTTERGHDALRVLSRKFGIYASVPPLS